MVQSISVPGCRLCSHSSVPSSCQVTDPLDQALKFLRPLQNLASSRIETHLLAYEVFSRKGTLLLTHMYELTENGCSHLSQTSLSCKLSSTDRSYSG